MHSSVEGPAAPTCPTCGCLVHPQPRTWEVVCISCGEKRWPLAVLEPASPFHQGILTGYAARDYGVVMAGPPPVVDREVTDRLRRGAPGRLISARRG